MKGIKLNVVGINNYDTRQKTSCSTASYRAGPLSSMSVTPVSNEVLAYRVDMKNREDMVELWKKSNTYCAKHDQHSKSCTTCNLGRDADLLEKRYAKEDNIFVRGWTWITSSTTAAAAAAATLGAGSMAYKT